MQESIPTVAEEGTDLRVGKTDWSANVMVALKSSKTSGITVTEIVKVQVGTKITKGIGDLARRRVTEVLQELKDFGVAESKGVRWYWWRWAP